MASLFVNFQLNLDEAIRRLEYWGNANQPKKVEMLNKLIDEYWNCLYFEPADAGFNQGA